MYAISHYLTRAAREAAAGAYYSHAERPRTESGACPLGVALAFEFPERVGVGATPTAACVADVLRGAGFHFEDVLPDAREFIDDWDAASVPNLRAALGLA